SVAQGRLDGRLEMLRGVDDVGDEPAHPRGVDLVAMLHDRPSAPGEALVAVVDLDQRLQARTSAVELAAEVLDFGGARLGALDQLGPALLELLSAGSQIHAGLAQMR